MRWGAMISVLLGLGCGFDSKGVGSASGSVGDEGDSTGGMSGSTEVTSDGSAEGGVTTSDASASGPDASTTTVDPSTTTPGDTGPGTTTITTTTTTGGSTDGGSTTTGGTGAGYPPCPTGQDSQCRPGYNCIPILDQQNTVLSSFCGDMDCVVDSDCAAPSDGNATPQCLQFSTPVCTLTCNFGETCPTGMICEDTDAGSLCAWP